ncbi:hypothetical protein [Enterococcus phage vB_Efs22_KEN09]
MSSKNNSNEEHFGSIPCGSKAKACSSMKNNQELFHWFHYF